MSLELFNAVPARAIEVLVSDDKSYFKRADLGRFLEIVDIATIPCSKIAVEGRAPPYPSERQSGHDMFVDLDAALEIVVRSRNPKAVELTKWLTRKGVERLQSSTKKLSTRETCILLCLTTISQNHRTSLNSSSLATQACKARFALRIRR